MTCGGEGGRRYHTRNYRRAQPQPCEIASWTLDHRHSNCSQQHATCSSFQKSYHFGPRSSNSLPNNYGFLGGKRICACLSLPSHSSWMTVSLYSLVSLDCWFTFITLALELKVFIMAFSYVLHFGCSSSYSSSSPCPPFAHWPFSPPISLLVSCHIYVPNSSLSLYFLWGRIDKYTIYRWA